MSGSFELPAPRSYRLSLREEQIVKLLLRGKRNSEIAQELSLSAKTIKGYMTTLMVKLNVRNRLEVVLAVQKLNPEPPRSLQTDERAPCNGRDTLVSPVARGIRRRVRARAWLQLPWGKR